MEQDYTLAFWGLFTILLILFVQWFVASAAKAKQPGAVPGKIDESLSHSSFVFRSHRTFMNSLENMPMILGSAFLAILVGADPLWTGVFLWAVIAMRVVHMILYYAIATEKNPSPRSYFFMAGVMANLGILALIFAALV